MTTATISPTQRLAVIKHLANGKAPDIVATIVKMPRETVVDIGSHHGYPDKDKLTWAADILAKKIDEEQSTIPAGAPARPHTPGAATSTPAAPGPRPVPQPDGVLALLNTAKAHPSKRIQAAADRAFDQLDRVRTLLREDEEKHAERRKADAEKAAARAEVERLEQQLAKAKAKLRGTTPTPAKPKAKTEKRETGPGDHTCGNDGCDRTFDTPQGRSLHERMRCEHRPNAEAS